MRTLHSNSLILPLLLVIAFVLRAWGPEKMSIEHFDEGVYASNLFSDHLGFRYPDRQLYAPPLLPAIFEWVLILSGGRPHAVMWVNVVLGTALVAAVFWTTKELLAARFPPLNFPDEEFHDGTDSHGERSVLRRVAEPAAFAASALVACSDIFIQYSRAALTDIPVCLWMTLAVGTGIRALGQGRWSWGLLSGLLTTIAWWTKYNGWLPLAILGAGVAGWLVFTRSGRASLWSAKPLSIRSSPKKKKEIRPAATSVSSGLRLLIQWSMIAGIAGLLWLPYLSELQSRGGYAAIAANHKGYMVGLAGWGSSVWHHLLIDRYYAGWASMSGWLIAGMLFFVSSLNQGRSAHVSDVTISQPPALRTEWIAGAWSLGIVVLLMVTVWIAGLIPVLCVAALFVPLCCYVCPALEERCGSIPLGMWILLAWIAGLGLATPFYRPYPRLILPWMIGMMMAAGIGLSLLMKQIRGGGTSRINGSSVIRPLLSLPLVLIVLVNSAGMMLLKPPGPPTRSPFLEDRRGLKQGADQIRLAIESDLKAHMKSTVPELDCVIYVLAEPGLYYHLAAQEDQTLKYITQPASDLGMLTSGKVDRRVPAYLITGPHAQVEATQLYATPDRVRFVGTIPYAPSPLVLLDDFLPAALPQHHSAPLQLWAVR